MGAGQCPGPPMMSEHYPRIRIRDRSGALIREGLSIEFYMRPQTDSGPGVIRALETYLSAVEPQALTRFADMEGDWQTATDAEWARIRQELESGWGLNTDLTGSPRPEQMYDFEYRGKRPDLPAVQFSPDAMSGLSFWLPTEYIEEHGPGRVRELAIAISSHLPLLCSGYMGLCFQAPLDYSGVREQVTRLGFRYPGMDIADMRGLSWNMGTRARGPAWLTFLGPPLIERLGGVARLRSDLRSEGTTVQTLPDDRALITLGPWPEAGDTERGDSLPAYRELARLLEPWLYFKDQTRGFYSDERHRWERRFLD